MRPDPCLKPLTQLDFYGKNNLGEESKLPLKKEKRDDMAHKRKDSLVPPTEWAKHLRPFGKRKQNKLERLAAKKEIKKYE